MLTILISTLAIAGLLGTAAFFALTRRGQKSWLSAALGVAAVVEFLDVLSLFCIEGLLWKRVALIAESFLPPVWLYLSLTWFRGDRLSAFSPLQKIILAGSLVFPGAAIFYGRDWFFYSPDFATEKILFLNSGGLLFYGGIMAMMVLAMANLERTFVTLPRSEVWSVKLEIIGAGVLMAMLAIYYSQSLLYRTLDLNLITARSAAAIIAVVLMGYSRLTRGGRAKVHVSRNLACKSLVIFFVALYLLGLGLVGEGMRYLDAPSRRSLFLIFFMVSGTGVVLVLLSETLRRKLRVAIHKNFFRSKYDYRQQWLFFTQKLASARGEKEFQTAVLTSFCEIFAVSGAALYLRDEGGNYLPKAGYRLGVEQPFGPVNSLVGYLRDRGWVFNARERDPVIHGENGSFFSGHQVSFVVPLLFNRDLEGFIVLGNLVNSGEVFSYEDYDLMKMLGRQATSGLLNFRYAGQLSDNLEMAAVGRVSAFVMHDLKNLVGSLALVVENAGNYMENPDFRHDMLETLATTVRRMNALIFRLKNLGEKPVLDLQIFDLRQIAVEEAKCFAPEEVQISGETVLGRIDPTEIRKVLLNLIQNGIESGKDRRSPVRVEVGNDGWAFLRVSDQGCGMSEEFIKEHLFRPFRTTKNKGFGIGLYQCKIIIGAHGGRIEVLSEPGRGSTFTVRLPLADDMHLDLCG